MYERLAAQDGLTLIEVLVTALIVGLMALGLVGLDAVGRTTADQRRRAQAFQVAQADQERVRALSADQLATLSQARDVTLDGVLFRVTSVGQFISSSSGSAGCSSTSAAADYAKVTTTVEWDSNRRADIVVQSLVTPRVGGSLVARVADQTAAALPGVRIDVAGADPSTDAVRRFGVTDSAGCTIFGTLTVGDYTVTATRAGYVDYDGDATPSGLTTTTAGNTTGKTFTMGQAGTISANFSTTTAAGTISGQLAPRLNLRNTSMAADRAFTPSSPAATIATTQTLFPFSTSTPSGAYVAWAGKCTVPPTFTTASLSPGATLSLTGATAVKMPAMVVSMTYAGTARKPNHIEITDSCGNNWQPELATQTTLPAPTTGWLRYPGQPYGTYSICADYRFQGASGSTNSADYRKVTMTGRANTSFTAANTTAIAITTSSSTGFC